METIRDRRIYQHPEFFFHRGDEITLLFEGHRLKAFTTEPVGVALFAWSVPVTLRSLKFHRPRGMFCVNGKCAGCLMQIDGVPNMRACKTFCRDNMTVMRPSALPSAGTDLLQTADFIFQKGFPYHHLATSPQWLNKLALKGIRAFSGTGDLPTKTPATPAQIQDIETDVAVIGGGPAGIAAALAAASAKANVTLIDDHQRPGGHLLGFPELIDDVTTGLTYCTERAALLIDKGVNFVRRTECIGYFEEGFFICANDEGLIRLHPKRVVLATGAYDRNPPFAQNDLPNIFSVRGLSKIMFAYGVKPGDRAFLIGSNDQVLSLGMRLPQFGVELIGIAEPGDKILGNPEWAQKIQASGVPIFLNHKPAKAVGRFKLKGLELQAPEGRKIKTECDLIAIGAHLSPAYELAAQAGVDLSFDRAKDGYFPVNDQYGRTNVSEIFVAGEITGEKTVDQIRNCGRIAGLRAAGDLYPDSKIDARLATLVSAE